MIRAALLLGICLFAQSAWPATHFLTIAGLGGEPDYEQRFALWARELDAIWRSQPDSTVETLSGPDATRERARRAFAAISKRAAPDDSIVLALVGHGSFDGAEYKLNLPGPDMPASEIARLLDRLPARKQLVVNMTSASGAMLVRLRRGGRVIITATKSGTEKNATVFARYWVQALRDPVADTDKNGSISALEAFRYAQRETARFYEAEKRLATEHAMLEDTGDGEGVRDPSPENGEGLLASSFVVVRADAASAREATGAKRALANRRQELERQIEALKYQKSLLEPDEYRKRLTGLLLDLAKTQAELDK